MKNITIGVLALLVLSLLAITLLRGTSTTVINEPTEVSTETPIPVEPDNGIGDGAEPLPEESERKATEQIGSSADGTAITAHHYGNGETEVLFIGGIHSGFAPNTVAVATELMGALEAGDITVPENITVTVIPNLNPDATAAPNAVEGRLNANGIDLNRNFDCEWETEGTWRSQTVDGGSAPFSESESAAIRDYVTNNKIAGAVVWYAASGGVFTSNCRNGVLSETTELTNLYADAAGYSANEEFDFYKITGDMVNWLTKENIPAISVLLSDYTNPEWSKNEKGIEAVLEYFKN